MGQLPTPETSPFPIGSMYGIYGNIYHQYTPSVSIYTIHGSYGFSLLALSSLCQVALDNGHPAVRGGFQAGPQPGLPAMPPRPPPAGCVRFFGVGTR